MERLEEQKNDRAAQPGPTATRDGRLESWDSLSSQVEVTLVTRLRFDFGFFFSLSDSDSLLGTRPPLPFFPGGKKLVFNRGSDLGFGTW